jgi:hypothetical protein
MDYVLRMVLCRCIYWVSTCQRDASRTSYSVYARSLASRLGCLVCGPTVGPKMTGAVLMAPSECSLHFWVLTNTSSFQHIHRYPGSQERVTADGASPQLLFFSGYVKFGTTARFSGYTGSINIVCVRLLLAEEFLPVWNSLDKGLNQDVC